MKNKGFIEMPTIKAGQSGSITDGLGDKASTIIFTCKVDDSGAVFHRSYSDNYVDIGNKDDVGFGVTGRVFVLPVASIGLSYDKLDNNDKFTVDMRYDF